VWVKSQERQNLSTEGREGSQESSGEEYGKNREIDNILFV
jgi:hypothetical protein